MQKNTSGIAESDDASQLMILKKQQGTEVVDGISKYSKQEKQNTSEDKCGSIAGGPADAGQAGCTDQKADQNAVITCDGASLGQDTAINGIKKEAKCTDSKNIALGSYDTMGIGIICNHIIKQIFRAQKKKIKK